VLDLNVGVRFSTFWISFLIFDTYKRSRPSEVHFRVRQYPSRRLATCPFTMETTTNPPQSPVHYLEVDSDGESEDAESLASNETDDGQEHAPEKIIAELKSDRGACCWYLVKWQDCPVIRSSWELYIPSDRHNQILADWEAEKRKQERGESTPLDLLSFSRAVLEVEEREKQKRTLRRLKRRAEHILSILDD
jgi:hypothetical protein